MYHAAVIRTTLTQNLGMLATEVYDEVYQGFLDVIPATQGMW